MPGLTSDYLTIMENKGVPSDNLSPTSSPLQKDATPNSRKSRRSVGKPDYYGSSPILVDVVTASPKRKVQRSAVSDNRSGNESDSSTSVDFNGKETSFRKPQSVKKATPGRPRRTPVRGNSRKSSASVNTSSASSTGKESLFDIVKGGKSALQAVIDDWIDCYSENRVSAVVDLIQYFIQCCGCKGEVTQEMIESDDTVVAIRQLTEKFDEDSHEYPMIMAGPASRKFKSNFCHFIELLVEGCQNTIMYDDFFMDTVISWLIGLSDSQVRAFRHTSTIAAHKLVTALIGVVANVVMERDNAKKQLDGENKKPSAKRSRERIEMLNTKHDELEQKIADIQETMDRVFSGVFVHRYRDVRPEIRATAIAELGIWMQSYSDHFLHQNYLKYTGWTLHDKIGDVRLKALQTLEDLYEDDDFVPQLELFTDRFKERMVNMTMDKDAEVAVHAVRLSCLLLRHTILDEENCSEIEQLVFSKIGLVAREAGKFLVLRLKSRAERLSPTKGRKGAREMLKKCSFVKLLIEFFLKAGIHEQTSYLVDSLYEHCPLVKDWKLMTDMLLDAHPLVDLNDEEEGVLIDMIAASCRQTSTGSAPVGRVIKKVGREKRLPLDEKHALSSHFVVVLPDLVRKFGADVKKLTAIVSISRHFDLDVYGEMGLKNKFQELVDLIMDMFLRHSDKDLLDVCAQSLSSLNDNDFAFKQVVEVSKSKLIENVVEKFTKAISNGIPTEDDKNDQYYFDLGVSLKRITALSRCHDLEEWGVFKYLNEIIQRGTSSSVEDEVLINSLTCAHLVLLWGLTSLNAAQPNKMKLKALRKRVTTFVGQLDELLQFSNAAVQEQAYLMLSDLLVFFAKQLKNVSPLLSPLTVEIDRTIQVRVRDYVMSFVFAIGDSDDEEEEDNDERSSEIHRRRVVLSAFCKLISYNIFDVRLAAPIFGQLVTSYSHYGDIIKMTMSKARDISNVAFTKTLLLSLQQAYESLLSTTTDSTVTWSSAEMIPIKELCHKFALVFGVDTRRETSRQCVITFHREGILYALRQAEYEDGDADTSATAAPPNLSFLEIVNEFTYRLIQQDKNGVLEFLDEKAKQFANKKGLEWTPFLTYRSSIVGVTHAGEERGPAHLRATRGAGRKAMPGRKKRKVTKGALTLAEPAAVVATGSHSDASDSDADVTPTSPLGRSRLDNDSENDTADEFQRGTPASDKQRQKNSKRPASRSEHSDDDSDSDPMDNVPLSSQRSWLSSQKQTLAKPRVSYGSKTKPPRKRQRDGDDDSDSSSVLATSLLQGERSSLSKRIKRASTGNDSDDIDSESSF